MAATLKVWDLEWITADEPDSNRRESMIAKGRLRYFIKTRTPLGQLVRQMNEGDSIDIVDTAELTHFKARCYMV